MKTFIDAVNESKAEWSNIKLGGRNTDGFYITSHASDVFYLGGVTTVFRQEEFNKCVDELSRAEWMRPVMSKGIYTQTMCDAGVLPSVGMSCRVCISSGDKGESGHIEFTNDIGCLFRYDGNNLCDFYLSDDVDHFKPLTPPITLISGGLYLFDVGDKKQIVGEAYLTDFTGSWMINVLRTNGSYKASVCTNIKLLEVKD